MEFIKKQIHSGRGGKVIVDQFYVDDDFNVPDAKPDVSRVVLAEGTLKVEEIQPVENYLRVTGKLFLQILYVTDESVRRLAAVEHHLPVEEMVYIEENKEQDFFVRSTRVELSVSVIHSRKLSLRALVELELGSRMTAEEELTVDVDSEIPLYKKTRNVELLQLRMNKKDIYRIKEEVTLPGSKEDIGTLLWTEVSARKMDTKLESDALILRGELLLFVFYESPEGKLCWMEQTVPYEGRVECRGADTGMYHHMFSELGDVSVDVRMDDDGEMRALGIEGTLKLCIAIYEEEQVEVLTDAYSLVQNCQLETAPRMVEELVFQNHSKCKVNEQLSLPELREDILQICHSSAKVQVEHMEPSVEGLRIEGMLHVSFLYVKENDEVPFDTWQGMVPFSCVMETNGDCSELEYDITHALEQLSVSLLGNGEIEIKAILGFCSFFRRKTRIENITGMTFSPYSMEEVGKRPGIIGYIVKEGEELWTLAKRYHTTVQGICEINGLEGDTVKAGDKILIFKENVGIL